MFNPSDTTRTLSTLLIACDDANRGAVMELLLAQPVQLAIADSQEEGEARFADLLPDLVFLLHSSSLDAFALLEKMRKRWGCRVHGVIIGGSDDSAAWKRRFLWGRPVICHYPLMPPHLRRSWKELKNSCRAVRRYPGNCWTPPGFRWSSILFPGVSC